MVPICLVFIKRDYNMNRTVLLDVDDVLLSYSSEFLKHYGIDYDVNGQYKGFEDIPELKNKNVCKMVEDFNKSPWFSCLPPREGAKHTIENLLSSGYSIKLITSCGATPETRFFRAVNLIDVFGKEIIKEVTYAELGECKKKYLTKYNPSDVVLWVEDTPRNYFHGVSLGINSVLLSTPFNKYCHEDAVVVNSWNEISDIIRPCRNLLTA